MFLRADILTCDLNCTRIDFQTTGGGFYKLTRTLLIPIEAQPWNLPDLHWQHRSNAIGVGQSVVRKNAVSERIPSAHDPEAGFEAFRVRHRCR